MLITVSGPTLLLPAVDTNTDEVPSGGIKVDKKAKREEKIRISPSLDARAFVNNAVHQTFTHLPHSKHRKGLISRFLVVGWGVMTSSANES